MECLLVMPDKTHNPDPHLQDSPDWEALARYLAGESPPEEVRTLEARFAAQPADFVRRNAFDLLEHEVCPPAVVRQHRM